MRQIIPVDAGPACGGETWVGTDFREKSKASTPVQVERRNVPFPVLLCLPGFNTTRGTGKQIKETQTLVGCGGGTASISLGFGSSYPRVVPKLGSGKICTFTRGTFAIPEKKRTFTYSFTMTDIIRTRRAGDTCPVGLGCDTSDHR